MRFKPGKISYVFPTRNENKDVVERTIRDFIVTTSGFDVEVTIVDDASETPVQYQHPQVKIIRNETPIGACRSRRLGFEHSEGEVFVSTDAHMTFGDGWLQAMLAHVDSGSLLCAPWMNYERNRVHCWGAELAWSSERDHYQNKVPGMIFRHLVTPQQEEAAEIPMVIGACYVMKRESYEKMGGYCPHFQIWGSEEQDLCSRAWMGGYGVKCIRDAEVGHLDRGGDTLFPYEVNFDYIEFNQLLTVRTVFSEDTIATCERELFYPLSDQVRKWFDETDYRSWRNMIQGQRKMSDGEFFERFMPEAPFSFDGSACHFQDNRRHAKKPTQTSPNLLIPAALPTPEKTWLYSELPSQPGLSWEAACCFDCKGAVIGIRSTSLKGLGVLEEHLPLEREGGLELEVDVVYSIVDSGEDWYVYRQDTLCFGPGPLQDALDPLAKDFLTTVAMNRPDDIFVKAKLTRWKGRALILHPAQDDLCAELLKRGASLLDSNFAIFNREGVLQNVEGEDVSPVILRLSSDVEEPQVSSPGAAFTQLMQSALFLESDREDVSGVLANVAETSERYIFPNNLSSIEWSQWLEQQLR